MTQRLLFAVIFTGLLVLAVVGWTAQGMRWVGTGGFARAFSNLLNVVKDRSGAAASLLR
jgi:hypothetical protein